MERKRQLMRYEQRIYQDREPEQASDNIDDAMVDVGLHERQRLVFPVCMSRCTSGILAGPGDAKWRKDELLDCVHDALAPCLMLEELGFR